MVKICQTRLLKLNFEIIPKKHIFRFLPKISAGHAWSWKIFLANFQILGPLGVRDGWLYLKMWKSQNHCTLVGCVGLPETGFSPASIFRQGCQMAVATAE